MRFPLPHGCCLLVPYGCPTHYTHNIRQHTARGSYLHSTLFPHLQRGRYRVSRFRPYLYNAGIGYGCPPDSDESLKFLPAPVPLPERPVIPFSLFPDSSIQIPEHRRLLPASAPKTIPEIRLPAAFLLPLQSFP